MSSKWTFNEEKELINQVKHGGSMETIATTLKRSPNAIDLRLKKIIYGSIAEEGVPVKTICDKLHMDKDKVMQHFYSYQDFIQKRGQKVSKLVQQGGNKASEPLLQGGDKPNSKYDKLHSENKKLECIIKNITLKQEINKLLKSNKVSAEFKKKVKHMLKKNI